MSHLIPTCGTTDPCLEASECEVQFKTSSDRFRVQAGAAAASSIHLLKLSQGASEFPEEAEMNI